MRWAETRPIEQTRHQSWVWVRQFHCSEWNTEHTCTFVRGFPLENERAVTTRCWMGLALQRPVKVWGGAQSAGRGDPLTGKKHFLPLSLSFSLSIPRSCSPFPPSSLISSFSFFPALWFLSPTRLDSFCLSALTHALFVVWPRMFAEEIFHVCLLFNLTIQTHSCSNTVIKCQPVFNQTNYCLLLAVTSCVHIFK